MYVYKITNKFNGKVYIGQSIRPIEERFKRHINDSINNVLDTHFARAIRKYGVDSFDLELVDIANTQEELNEKEQYYIRKYNSINEGYNETDAIYKCGGNTYKYKTNDELNELYSKAIELYNNEDYEQAMDITRMLSLKYTANEDAIDAEIAECIASIA